MNKIGFLGFCFLFVICSISFAANGLISGSGSEADPYLVEDLDDFIVYAKDTSYWSAGKYTSLMSDIDFSSLGTIKRAPVAPYDFFGSDLDGVFYEGYFDGNGHVILNLSISPENFGGVFGIIGPQGCVKNLRVVDFNISGIGHHCGGISGENQGTVENCFADGFILGTHNLGGLAGVNGGIVRHSHSSGQVISTYADFAHVGGLVGQNYEGFDSTGIILYSYSNSDVYASTSAGKGIGGLVGISWGGHIQNCYASGNVTGHSYLGGFIGTIQTAIQQSKMGIIDNCYSTGNVTGNNRIGGFAGENGSSYLNYCYSTGSASGSSIVGGFCGCIYFYPYDGFGTAIIEKCYSTGPVTGGSESGGFVGRHSNGSQIVNDCFWDYQTSGFSISAGGTGKTTLQMQDINIYLNDGWDFDGESMNGTEDIWRMPARDYPVLAWRFGVPNINSDSVVDISDLAAFARHWLTIDGDSFYSIDADFDGSGDISLLDLQIFADQWLHDFMPLFNISMLYWPLDETSGSVAYESSEFHLDGTINGSPSRTRGINNNNCLELDGANDYIEIQAYMGVIDNHPRAVAAWIKADEDLDNTDNGYHTIINWGQFSYSTLWACMLDSLTGRLVVNIYGARIIGGPDLEDGQWHHIAVVLPENSEHINHVKLFVDGLEIETVPNDSNTYIHTTFENHVSIGAMLSPGQPANNYFKGSIDEVYLFNYALNPQQIAELANISN